jgi:hypothetical protein
MDYNIDLVYSKYIKPLSYDERVSILQRILKDFVVEQKKEFNSQMDKLRNLQKFKGIAKNSNQIIIDEYWYKQ